jgi:predicted DNA-binding helix-hairpin-helix protein
MVTECIIVMDTGGFKCANENFMLCRYVGDSSGNVSLLKLDLGQRCLVDMPYCIPFAESYGRMYYRYTYMLHT